jgi:hypothetical protein
VTLCKVGHKNIHQSMAFSPHFFRKALA